MEEINQYMPLSHDWNNERLETLKTMFPDLFTSEGKLNADELKKLIDPQSINETERYEFRWFGKSQAKRNAFTPSNATLVYDEKRSVNPDKAENLIIEGENLEVLKLLSAAYREKVKCIYIDPPYNTGKDFVYSDNFSQNIKGYWEDAGITEDGVKIDTNTETDGRYHSNWLNMMYSRLLVARALLKQEGVIFISIDNNEIHNLRKLCDEVFGEENLIGQITNINNPKGRSDDKFLATSHEYVLVYAKNKLETVWFGFEPAENILDRYNKTDENGGVYREIDLRKTGDNDRKEDRPNLFYYFLFNADTQEFYPTREELVPDGFIQIFPSREDEVLGNWRWGIDTAIKDISKLIPKYMTVRKKWGVFEKDYLDSERVVKPISSWNFKDVNSERGSEQFIELGFAKEIFPKPKPVGLIKRIATLALSKNDILLDFFGGSGSTGHAISELNKADGGNRKFILIQIPEATEQKSEAFKAGYNKISDITIERNKRVIERILEQKKTEQLDIFKEGQDDKGLGFKVFKLTKSKFPRVEWTPAADKTEAENIEALKKYIADKEAQLVTMFNREELTTEILLKKGFNLNYKTEKQEQFKDNDVYLATDGNKQTLICLDAIMHDKTVEHLKTNNDKQFICLERALDTTKKWNLKQYLGDKLHAF